MTDWEAEQLLWEWQIWARPEQLPPDDDFWAVWLILAGRGFGKTRTGAETIREWACGSTPLSRGQYHRIALVAETAADGRDVMVEGESGILAVHPKAFRPHYEPSKRRLTWPNGAIATIYNGTEPEQLRGPQHDAAWLDELAKWKLAQQTWDQLQFTMRLGHRPRQIITTTPRNIPVLKEIMKSPMTRVTRGTTSDNMANLAPAFVRMITDKYGGTRLGRQELSAELLEDVPGALWTHLMMDATRIILPQGQTFHNNDVLPEMKRIVIAIDPSGTSGDEESKANHIGLVAVGLGVDDRGYVLDDRSGPMGPNEWSRRAVNMYKLYGADRVVAETNYGGAMVESVIRTVDPNVSYKSVVASRGKVLRAEPVSALYEQGRVSHVGKFDQLEDQMCLMATDGFGGTGSPDRVDALVWAITELMLGGGQYEYKIRL